MGLFQDKEEQSREIARQLAVSLASMGEKLGRLQEQQRSDERRLEAIDLEIRNINLFLREIEKGQVVMVEELEQQLDRIQFLETSLTCEMENRFLSLKAFHRYQDKLKQDQFDKDKNAIAQQKKLRKQWGVIIGGALAVLAPKIYELIAWLIDKIIHH